MCMYFDHGTIKISTSYFNEEKITNNIQINPYRTLLTVAIGLLRTIII